MYYGLDSIALIALAADLEKWLGYQFRENLLETHPTIEDLSWFLAEQGIRGIFGERPDGAFLRPAAAGAPVRVSDFLLVPLQLALVLAVVYQFELAGKNHLFPILCIAAG